MRPQLVIRKRFIRSLLGVNRCSLSWASGRGLLKVYWVGQMQPQMGIWKRFIRNLYGVDRFILSWGSGKVLLEVYQWWTDAASAGDLEEVYYKFISGRQMQPQLGMWKRFIGSLFRG